MDAPRPLDGVTVVSMGQAVAGPLCSAFFADLGADVVKVEPPAGDSIRGAGRTLNGHTFSHLYELYNRDKRSIGVDVKDPAGMAVVYELVADADVFVQNFGPDVAERLAIDYETLREHNEDLVYVSISGYGESGPMAGRPSFDALIQHATGLSSRHGFEGDPPMRAQCFVADYFAGYNAAMSALAALHHRAAGGGGQKCEISMFDSLVHTMNGVFELYNNLGETPERRERGEDPKVAFGAERVSDGWIAVAFTVTFPKIWRGFCELVDRSDLLDHPDYRTPDDRADEDRRDQLNGILRKWLSERTAAEAVERLNEHGIPAEHTREIADVPEMDHVQERGTFVELDHPLFDSIELTNTPLHLSETPAEVRRRSPLLGEHSRDVLEELGYTDDEIRSLHRSDVVVSVEEESN